MASIIEVPSGRAGYRGIVEHVMNRGTQRKPRGLLTLDLGHTTIALRSPYNALPIGLGRNLSRRIAAAEAVQLIGSFSDPQLLLAASANFGHYVEDDGHFHGAYGTRINGQLERAVAKLQADKHTRQAVITLWNPTLDNAPAKRDYPCTLSLVLSITHDNMLELDVTMRSNDVWRGLPYDLFQFSQLQLTVARVLGIEPGEYRHHAHSLHIYETDLEPAIEFIGRSTFLMTEELPSGFGNVGSRLVDAMSQARRVAYPSALEDFSESEAWYWHVLRGHTPQRTEVPSATS